MSEWIVAKFGGSSVRDAQAMFRCANIVEANDRIKVVIISATYQTTNHLEEIARTALEKSDFAKKIEAMRERHLSLASDLLAPLEVRNSVRTLCEETHNLCLEVQNSGTITDALMDQIYSIGERLSSLIFADLLKRRLEGKRKVSFKDAREVLRTNSHFKRAEPQIAEIAKLTTQNWSDELKSETLVVTQGFIGSTADGKTTTLGREGSDYSAALFGEAIKASLVQIWTDVCGIATGDPRHVDNWHYLDELSYEEATLMAENGAKVLFERTLAPAERSQMNVFVGSSLESHAKGTIIRTSVNPKLGAKGVAYEPKTKVLTVVGLDVEKDKELEAALQKLGGTWSCARSLYQREDATHNDFKEVHSLVASWLK